jgi:hypothetical protein
MPAATVLAGQVFLVFFGVGFEVVIEVDSCRPPGSSLEVKNYSQSTKWMDLANRAFAGIEV